MQYKTINAAVVYEVSVPLRGYGFEIPWDDGKNAVLVFPSPCGDMVLKSPTVERAAQVVERQFPSPCGDVVLKCRLRCHI